MSELNELKLSELNELSTVVRTTHETRTKKDEVRKYTREVHHNLARVGHAKVCKRKQIVSSNYIVHNIALPHCDLD